MGETTTVYAVSLLGLILMLLFALAVVGFYVFYQNRLLKQQRALIQLENQQQQLLIEAGIQSQEAERQRIAADLHDSVGANLATSQLFVRQLSIAESSQEMQNTVIGLLDEVLISIRTITSDLAPETLFRFGVVEAIEDLIELIKQIPNLQIHFSASVVERFDNQQELALFRIVQELLANTIKHAQATEIRLELRMNDLELLLVYQDNGRGLPPNLSADHQGFGLRNIRSRSQFLNAKIDWPSSTTSGFQISLAFIPLPPLL